MNNPRDDIRNLIATGGITAKDRHRRTPLYLASRHGYRDLVKELIDGGADLDAKSWDGWTPLHIAIYGDHTDVVKDLIVAGADVNLVRGQTRRTPLHTACLNENIEIIRLLLDAGANPGAIDADGNSLPHHLVSQEIVELLKMYEIDIKEPECM